MQIISKIEKNDLNAFTARHKKEELPEHSEKVT